MEEQIQKLPGITEGEDMFYGDGEFESVLLADFKEDADRIDAKYADIGYGNLLPTL